MFVSNFQVFLLIFSSSPPIFDCLYCLQLKLSWTLSAILMMSKFVVFSLSVLSRFALLSLDVHSAVSSSNNGQSLLLLCFMTDASNQLLAASLSLRESLFPPPFKNNQLSSPPIPLSLSFYHCIYALQLISSNIHNHFSASLPLSPDFSTF